jgi:hypothetical protein
MSTTFVVWFGEHVPAEQMASIATGIARHGCMLPGASDRDFSITVLWPSQVPTLKTYLAALERLGHARWSEIPN